MYVFFSLYILKLLFLMFAYNSVLLNAKLQLEAADLADLAVAPGNAISGHLVFSNLYLENTVVLTSCFYLFLRVSFHIVVFSNKVN